MDEIIELSERKFPPLLREIPDAPKKLFLRGTLPSFDFAWLTVVGSRAMSRYGKAATEHLIKGLSGYPVAIVSGLAYGIDAHAHKMALEAGLPAIAVPGSGLDWDVLYPRANVSLAKRILEAGGALLSEFEPDMKANEHTFPKRNRIMAGLSKATLVIEARERSGTLITARLTAEYNRELLVVPGSIFDEGSAGVHQFLKLGATPVGSTEDILRALGLDVAAAPRRDLDLSEVERKIFDILAESMPRDDLVASLEMPIADTNVILSAMEIKGLIVEEYGRVRRA